MMTLTGALKDYWIPRLLILFWLACLSGHFINWKSVAPEKEPERSPRNENALVFPVA